MSKKRDKFKTKTSEYNYFEEYKKNADLATKWLETLFPELAEVFKLMQKFDISCGDLIDYVYNLRTVKTHGYGHVQTTIFNGSVTKVEALIRTIRAIETERKV